jgi:hypothetical protein
VDVLIEIQVTLSIGICFDVPVEHVVIEVVLPWKHNFSQSAILFGKALQNLHSRYCLALVGRNFQRRLREYVLVSQLQTLYTL